ncbi:olfactory receptor 5J3-like [Lissotriton helveticus]
MEVGNMSSNVWFLIVGFSDIEQLRVPLFVAFLGIYVLTLVGNLLILAVICSNLHLHTPMYFFLSNLSIVDITYTSIVFPQMFADFFLQHIHVSLKSCLLVVYFFMFMLSTEILLLTVMALDRYVAICDPLRYPAVMNKDVCIRLAAGSWLLSLLMPLAHILLLSELSFCEPHTINHFFCDVAALMKLACSDTGRIERLNYIMGAIYTVMSFLLIVVSYINIASSILKMKSKGGRQKAVSTCASHLTVVVLFYVSLCSTYMRPASTYSLKGNKIMSLSYIAVTPLLNPIIYTLKNTEFKKALKKKGIKQMSAGILVISGQGNP